MARIALGESASALVVSRTFPATDWGAHQCPRVSQRQNLDNPGNGGFAGIGALIVRDMPGHA